MKKPPEGLPFSIIGPRFPDAAKWLVELSIRADSMLIYADRAAFPEAVLKRLRGAVVDSHVAIRAIETGDAPGAALAALSAFHHACFAEIEAGAAPKLKRDNARQAGTKLERRPEITKWIQGRLRRTPGAKSPDLWNEAPEWITDAIGQRRFAHRVTAIRKERRASN